MILSQSPLIIRRDTAEQAPSPNKRLCSTVGGVRGLSSLLLSEVELEREGERPASASLSRRAGAAAHR